MRAAFDGAEFRRILGHYPTGVCAITAMLDGEPVGMTVGSFTSVSLDPPLVAFFPDRQSASWARIEQVGHFCVNILGANQHDICRTLASRAEDKFERIDFRLSDAGLPIVAGVVAWIDCQLEAVHGAGDHFIAVGRVLSLDIENGLEPLLFYKGGYGQFTPLSIAGL
ncbi:MULTISPECIES: flavin reductase family protein [Sphingobium]|jgi:flavin reductase (DIM6/NTAB) family NADH-FMN oxidoreductase RutF|uniref:flavin reductase family protein n=1 Tax=Sphingobium TaxID=165695 RepID=UPI00159C5671|nr:flavin reductase family protein [Sphingobium sp. 15-1]